MIKRTYAHICRLLTVATLLSYAFSSQASEKLNGLAVHSALSQDQFIAALYLADYSDSPRSALLQTGAKGMELRVTTDKIFPRRFKRMWVEALAINSAPKELEKHAQHVSDFSRMLRVKMRQGDILRINKSAEATVVLVNGIELGKIEEPEFFDLLLRTWIGPVPLSSDFKSALLAGGKVNSDLMARFNATTPSEERTNAIADALREEQNTASRSTTPAPQAPVKPATPKNDASTIASGAQAAKNQTSPKQNSDPTDNKATAQTSNTANNSTKQASKNPPPSPEKTVETQVSSTPKAESQPQTVAILSEDDLFDDDSILAEDDDFGFSAEQLLSQQLFFSKLTKWTANFVQYPQNAINNNVEGTVRVTMTLKRNGKVVKVAFAEKADHDELNRAAAKAVRDASPYPAVPDEISGDNLVFTVPVVFRLR